MHSDYNQRDYRNVKGAGPQIEVWNGTLSLRVCLLSIWSFSLSLLLNSINLKMKQIQLEEERRQLSEAEVKIDAAAWERNN